MHARRSEFNGIVYHSGLEAKVAADLEYQRKAGELAQVERQIKMPLIVNGIHITNYIVDFRVTHNDGTVEFIEVKGAWTESGKMKARLFEALYTDGINTKYTIKRG